MNEATGLIREKPPATSSAEFAERQQRAIDAAVERGLDGLVVWSRDGASADCYGDVYYLTNYHTPVPPLTNTTKWADKGYCALVMSADRAPILLADTLDDPDDRIRVADARTATHLPQAVADVPRETGLSAKRIGLIGDNCLLARDLRTLEETVGAVQLERADDLLEELRYVKSEG
jgi:Xaa-Pro dipeptidase